MPRLTSFSCVCFKKAMTACHARHHLSMLFSKGDDGMPHPRSIELVRYPRDMISCHVQRRPTVCIVKGLCWHATSNFVQPCELPKGDDGMLCSTLSNQLYFPWAMMESYAKHRSFVCAVQERLCHAKPDVVRPCSFPMVMMACHAKRHLSLCEVQE